MSDRSIHTLCVNVTSPFCFHLSPFSSPSVVMTTMLFLAQQNRAFWWRRTFTKVNDRWLFTRKTQHKLLEYHWFVQLTVVWYIITVDTTKAAGRKSLSTSNRLSLLTFYVLVKCQVDDFHSFVCCEVFRENIWILLIYGNEICILFRIRWSLLCSFKKNLQ